MVTFNVDSLDFVDDEEARFGADADFATRFSSSNQRLELEDLTNASISYVPTDVGTDLVGGKFAETVSEGKALADDGNVYDSIQAAENAASSWVKVGPGEFNESISIDTTGLHLSGSGKRSKILPYSSGGAISVQLGADSVTISNLSVRSFDGSNVITTDASDTVIDTVYGIDGSGTPGDFFRANTDAASPKAFNCVVDGSQYDTGLVTNASQSIFANNILVNCNRGIAANTGDNIWVANIVDATRGSQGIQLTGSGDGDNLIGFNSISDAATNGIEVDGADNIVFNNRVRNSGSSNIADNATNTVLDANLTT